MLAGGHLAAQGCEHLPAAGAGRPEGMACQCPM